MPDDFRAADSKENKGGIILLTSARHPHYDSLRHMDMGQNTTSRKDSRKAAYPLRFKNKTQKERLEKAARKVRMSLRDFLLTYAEKAAVEIGGEAKAS